MGILKLTEKDLTKMMEKQDINGLINALTNKKDILIRYRAAEALGEIGSINAVDTLITTLKDEDGDVRSMAVYALGQIGDRRAVEPLIENLSYDDGEFKEMIIYSLGEIGGKIATNYLNLALEYDDPNIRWRVAEALGKIASRESVDYLINILEDDTQMYNSMQLTLLVKLEIKNLLNLSLISLKMIVGG